MKFERRLSLMTEEYEKYCINWRLKEGREDKVKTSKKVSQSGERKLVGRKTTLVCLRGVTAAVRKRTLALIKQRERGDFGWRTLAKEFKGVLKLEHIPSHETARRMAQELRLKGVSKYVARSPIYPKLRR